MSMWRVGWAEAGAERSGGGHGEVVLMLIEDPNMHQYAAFNESRVVECATLCVRNQRY